jgi:hypothetical protein
MDQKTTLPKKVMIPDPQKKFYQDQYASVTFVESVPCIKVKLNGVPQSSEHYQFVHNKLMDFISAGKKNYFRLHLLTDNSKAGLVLDEDINFYKMNVIPAIEEAGIRYHAIVLPENSFLRVILNQISLSTKKVKVEYFNSLTSASRWLRSH